MKILILFETAVRYSPMRAGRKFFPVRVFGGADCQWPHLIWSEIDLEFQLIMEGAFKFS